MPINFTASHRVRPSSSRSVIEVDVLIVGAGPAGAVCALNLAPFRRVLMIDRHAVPQPRIGEALPGTARRLLVDMRLWVDFMNDGHAPCYAYRSIWGGPEVIERDALRDPDGCGWHLDRARFETRLRAAAVARGTTMFAPARPVELDREAEGWRISLELGNRSLTAKTRLLVDAGGKSSQLLRKFGRRRRAESRLVCGWVAGADVALPRGLTHIEAEVEGWWYAAPLPGGGGVLSFHTDADLPAAHAARSAAGLLARAQHLIMLGEFAEPSRWHNLLSGFCAAHGGLVEASIGPDWVAVGDAALSFDPLSSQGLFNALFTGLAAAEAVDRSLSGDRKAFLTYAEELRNVRIVYERHLADWYGLEQRWPKSLFWSRRHARSENRL